MNLFDYKKSIVSEIIDKYEVAKEKRITIELSKGSIVKAPPRKSKLFKKEARFTKHVIFIVDLENLLDKLEEPYKTVIKKRYFDASLDTVRKDFELSNKREAYYLIRKSVNKFYDLLEKYWFGKG
ncbi:MAG TPA: hypothetical protein EYG91_05165 [Aquifex aeolicus]|nr:hypothetical protein [Aquifex aeolicus]